MKKEDKTINGTLLYNPNQVDLDQINEDRTNQRQYILEIESP
ncbi:hypothetical protein ACFLR8_02580 [Bacteroidota bacterium]